jgi:hypothetical protein
MRPCIPTPHLPSRRHPINVAVLLVTIIQASARKDAWYRARRIQTTKQALIKPWFLENSRKRKKTSTLDALKDYGCIGIHGTP